jgi:hypothetical protein
MNNNAASAIAGAPDVSVPVKRLSEILLASITALAATGEIEQACRRAGEAYVTLRQADPVAARRFDVFLHRMTRVENAKDDSDCS